MNSLKNLGTSFLMYQMDYDDQFPDQHSRTAGEGREGGWIYYDAFPVPTQGLFDVKLGSLYDYVGNLDIYVCPDDGTRNNASYGANSDARLANSAMFKEPTNVPLLLEEGATLDTPDDGCFNLDWDPPDRVVHRHNKGDNYFFVDGHVKWERWEDLYVLSICDVVPPINNY
jgi:prepilin-type processing-associated H-X9-DG protein